jgi:hypothetical protein
MVEPHVLTRFLGHIVKEIARDWCTGWSNE